jgi:hypothetical protein
MHVLRLKPLLLELDELCPVYCPVLIDQHLVPLFKKHGDRDRIDLIPVPAEQAKGVHIGNAADRRAVIVYPRCEIHHNSQVDPACPGCQDARFTIAKELVHCFDRSEEKTTPEHMGGDLIIQLIKRDWNKSAQASADGWGEIWAIELLVRYRHRLMLRGSESVNRSLRLASAMASNNYVYIASQFGAPVNPIRNCFADGYMEGMAKIRARADLPNTIQSA